MTGRTTAIVAAFAFTLLGQGCGDDPPVPGTITVSLVSPNANDGAILFNIRGPGISNVAPTSSSNQLFWRQTTNDEVKIIVVGNLTSGPVASLDVPDINDLAGYTTFVEQVADREDELRPSIDGYEITLPVTQVQGRVTSPLP